ncbi:MAG: RDD family protein [Chloroflexi bacterium]|nr:RDD family protein [Chloroflexota bacterium]
MGFWIRLAATLIDYLFAIIANILLLLIANITPFLEVLVVAVDIYIFYRYLKCKTPGMKLLKMKVVNAKGEDVGFWRGAFRQTFAKFLSFIFFLLGFFWIGWDKRKRGWHDHLAGTFVVRVQSRRPT